MTGEKIESAQRRARLARALKANIARRKAQAKGRKEAGDGAPAAAEGAEPPDEEECCPN